MRVTVVGATGNVGTSVLRSLVDDPQISSIVGVARRRPSMSLPKTEWVAADIVKDDLEPIFRGSDVVVHLAWLKRVLDRCLLPRPEGLWRRRVVAGQRHPVAGCAACSPDHCCRARHSIPRRLVKVPAGLVRAFAHWTWRLHLQPTPAGWVDMALQTPIMDTKRAREDLGWEPRWNSKDALMDLLSGLRDGATYDTPPLSGEAGGPGRIREFITGTGVGTGVGKDR